ncbi:MAG: rane protein-like protein [Caulobacteraceae bacterium]|nr:rane protein-like protein [Caulobacteraceae bacterium]
MTETPAGASSAERAISAAFLAMAAVCGVAAFVGLDASGYWIDELFSLFVTDHDGGLGEVMRRALTDTHPPAYYFIIHEWMRLFGSSETATRAFSAICATAALPALFFGLRGSFSLTARSFAMALAAGSKVFFEQSQNMRSYGLALLISSGLLAAALAIHRRLQAGERVSASLMAGSWALGLLGSFVHFYIFLAVGASHLFLLLGARTARQRAAIVLSGLSIAGLMAIYVVSLLGASQQDFHHMWFSNKASVLIKQALGGVTQSWSGLAIGGIVLLVLAPWADRWRAADGRPPPAIPSPPLAPLQLCGLVILGTVLGGLMVSFALAPSFGKRNLMILAPFFWALAAWLYDAVGPDWRRGPSRVLIGLLLAVTAANALTVRARLLPRNEEWRASAAYVASLPACAGQPIPVVIPFLFGPSTPFFRTLARERFFGRYDIQPARLQPLTPRELSGDGASPAVRALLHARATTAACPILAWGVHDVAKHELPQLRRGIAKAAGVPVAQVRVHAFADYKVRLLGFAKRRDRAFVFERDPSVG